MNLKHFETMDPNLLPGLINTALRNEFQDLEDLIKTHDLNPEALQDKLRNIGYEYLPGINQVRPIQTDRSG